MKQINPCIGMVTHIAYETDLSNELSAGIRSHLNGLFVVGAPYERGVNVTEDATWACGAVLAVGSTYSRRIPQTSCHWQMARAAALAKLCCRRLRFPASSSRRNTSTKWRSI